MAAQIALVLAALLCALVAGFLFAFAVVVMPGIRALEDREFLRSFRAMDGVIQRGPPLFGVVWLGSIVALVAALVLGVDQLAGIDRAVLVAAVALHLLGVQLPTFRVNVPLNNAVQALDLDGAGESACRAERRRFESRWVRWNAVRTALAVVVTALLLVLLLRA